MASTPDWNGKFISPHALLLDHDEVRIGLVRARLQGGPITEASERLAHLCLPHFEFEEKSVFPALALLPYLARGSHQVEMMGVMPLIAAYESGKEALMDEHEAIQDALLKLLHTAHRMENREFAKLAYRLRVHEWIEDQVIYPAVELIGRHLHDKYSN